MIKRILQEKNTPEMIKRILQEKNTSALFTNLDFVLLSVRPPCWILQISQDPLYFHNLPLLLNSAASIQIDRARRAVPHGSNTAAVKRQTSRVKLYSKKH